MTPRLSDLRPYVALLRPYLWWVAGGLSLAVTTLVGSLGLLGLSGGFLTATGLAGLTPETAQLYNVVVPAGAIRLFALLRTVGRWSERVVNHEATFRLLGQLRVWLYRRFSRLSPRQLGLWHGAEVLNRLTRDVDQLDNLYIRLLAPIGAATVVLGGLTALTWVLAPPAVGVVAALAVVGLVALPAALYLSARILSPRLVAGQESVRRALLDLVEGLEDTALHRPSWLVQRQAVLDHDAHRLADQVSLLRRGSAARAGLLLLIGLAVWGVVELIAALPAGAAPDGPWFVALTLLVLGTGEALAGLPAAWLELPGTASAARRLSDLADQKPDPAFDDTGPAASGSDLSLEGVTFAYDPSETIVQGASASWPAGTHVALLGPSGGGKTTLVRLLTRLEDAQAGTIRLGGVPLTEWDEVALRSVVTCAMQDPWAFTATVADNLRLGDPDASDEELMRVLDLVGLGAQVRAWPEGLKTWIEEGGHSLSGGQRRRLALARALLRRAAVTILDEPTEGLEGEAALALVDAIRSELAGRTLLWVTHRPQGLEAFPEVWRLSKGTLVRVGALESTLRSENPSP
jgi:ATP-binding cassette subfamily C protein CydC